MYTIQFCLFLTMSYSQLPRRNNACRPRRLFSKGINDEVRNRQARILSLSLQLCTQEYRGTTRIKREALRASSLQRWKGLSPSSEQAKESYPISAPLHWF